MRAAIEQDFQEIHELATEGGSKAIIDVGNCYGDNLAEQFAELSDFHDHAFWTFLERPAYWQNAVLFSHIDSIPNSYWRKRANMPSTDIDTDAATIKNFEQMLSNFFYRMQGRGKNCKVEYYKRNDLDYFFGYPEDYAQASIEWDKNEFRRRSHHPAFEVIFVYSKNNRTLDIHVTDSKKILYDLQAIFGHAILKTELPPDVKDERVYDLSPLKSRFFQFKYAPETGIFSVTVKKIRLKLQGKNAKITLEADTTHNMYTVYDLLDDLNRLYPSSQIFINQVGLKVTFGQNSASGKITTRSFHITYPNSCSLKYDDKSSLIRKMLIDSGIEPKILLAADECATV